MQRIDAARLINAWGDIAVNGGMFPLIVSDIPSHLGPDDAAYFRRTREARLGRKLEDAAAERDLSLRAIPQ